jgi:heme/copper-type cytochrome/quinol oxidase subunit 4
VSTDANEQMMVAHAIIGIILDVILMCLPVWVIYKKMMFSRKMMQVTLVFCVGIFAVICGVIRFWYMKTLIFAVDA